MSNLLYSLMAKSKNVEEEFTLICERQHQFPITCMDVMFYYDGQVFGNLKKIEFIIMLKNKQPYDPNYFEWMFLPDVNPLDIEIIIPKNILYDNNNYYNKNIYHVTKSLSSYGLSKYDHINQSTYPHDECKLKKYKPINFPETNFFCTKKILSNSNAFCLLFFEKEIKQDNDLILNQFNNIEDNNISNITNINGNNNQVFNNSSDIKQETKSSILQYIINIIYNIFKFKIFKK